MKKSMILLAAAVAAAATMGLNGCTHEVSNENSGPVEVRIRAGVSTRAVGTLWYSDVIGVTVTAAPDDSHMATNYLNAQYSTTANGATTADFTYVSIDDRILFDTEGEVSFAAYAPYQTSDGVKVLPGTDGDGVITGTVEDQSTDQESIDWLYGTGSSTTEENPEVTLTFKHVMSMIVINVSAGNLLTAEKVQGGTYTVGGLTLTGAFDVAPGSTTIGTAYADGTATDAWILNDYVPSETLYDEDDSTVETGISFTAIIYPHSSFTSLPFTATVDDLPFEVDLADSGFTAFEAGKTYTFNLTLSEIALTFTGCTIEDWTSGGTWDKEVNPGSTED